MLFQLNVGDTAVDQTDEVSAPVKLALQWEMQVINKAQKSQVTCPGSHRMKVYKVEFKPMHSDSSLCS